jgi:hypothetical protein
VPYVERPTFTQPVPAGAEIRTQGGHQYACWTDRAGKPVKALVLPTGRCRRTVPNRWVGVYRDHTGAKRKTPTFGDRAAALRAALEAERHAVAVKEGRATVGRPAAGGKALLRDQVADYLAWVEQKGRAGEEWRKRCGRLLHRLIAGAGLTTAAAVDAEALAAWLERQRRTGRVRPRKGRPAGEPLSVREKNIWVTALKAFGKWLRVSKRAEHNPFEDLACGNPELDRRHVRRSLPLDQFAALVAAAEASPRRVQLMPGPMRAALYHLAAYTGLRAEALARLTPESFTLAGGLPVAVYSSARMQKNRDAHGVAVHPDVGRRLAPLLAATPPGTPVFRGTVDWWEDASKMVQADLTAAGIPYRDAAGQVFDFHALRGQCGYLLASSGVPLVAAQQILDHSRPDLTANIYSRFGGELAGEVGKLPSLGAALGGEVGGTRRNGPPDAEVKGRRKTKKPRESQ